MSKIDLADAETIATLTNALTRAGVEGLEITTPDGHLRIVIAKGKDVVVSGSATTPQASASASTFLLKAPLAGHFRPSEPDDEASGSSRRQVSEHDILGFIAVGPILLPLPAGRAAMVRRRLADADSLVGFGEPLFELEQFT